MSVTQLNTYMPGQNLTNLANNVDYNRVGEDLTDITINHTTSPWTFTIKVGSLIEKDGNLYTVDTSDYTLQATDNTHNYIVFSGTAFTSAATRGTYDPEKGGFYLSGSRVLKYFIDADNDIELEMVNNTNQTPSSISSDYQVDILLENGGTTAWTAPYSKYYDIWVTGAGDDGGAGGNAGTPPTRGTSGGASGSTGKKRIYIEAGDVWTATFGASNVSVTDGTTSLVAGNAGGAVTGCDLTFTGGGVVWGGSGEPATGGSFGESGAPGSASIYGQGGTAGRGGALSSAGGGGGNGVAYGSGGGCGGGAGGGASNTGGSGGTGADGVVRIVG